MFVAGVLEEAEFYNIAELIHLVKDRIKHHHQKNQVRYLIQAAPLPLDPCLVSAQPPCL